MDIDSIKKIFILGAGTMGTGIGLVAARAGYSVFIRDIRKDILKKSEDTIKTVLEKEVAKKRISEKKMTEILSKITFTTDLEIGRDVDFVIEAIVESISTKKKLFQKLDDICPPNIILSTNTSSLSVTEIASITTRPSQVVGMHFFNPAYVMKPVEIVRGVLTSESTIDLVKALTERFGKTPVIVNDSPGFVVNRMLMPMINEASFALMEGVAKKEDIDKIMKLGLNHPMGPLELADLIGLDICLAILNTLYQEFNDPKYRPSPLIKKLVRAGHLGRKTGKGFYEYR
jgi:3-hydroxybutyryl-CoA dehydrogenase